MGGRVITGLTDDGSGQAWRLLVEQRYIRAGEAWLWSASSVS